MGSAGSVDAPSLAGPQRSRDARIAGPASKTARWLLLIHQIPPLPNYLRVKVGRRLARVGAVAIKSTVYALPRTDSALEDFEWIRREVTGAGGEAVLLAAHLLDGLSDRDVEKLFGDARDRDYAVVADEARQILKRAKHDGDAGTHRQLEAEAHRLQRRLEEILSIDFFDAPAREPARALVASLRDAIDPPRKRSPDAVSSQDTAMRGRTWVTRTGIKVDRIGSAWLIRRFIDAGARFKFVPAKGYLSQPSELRFDMFEAEYTHEGDLCTFEVLCSRFELQVPGLARVAELVHDVDLKDGKFGHPQTAGLSAQIDGIAALHQDDETRLERGSAVFESLLAYFAKTKG
ncbi:MAG TPA: chromate resistance protein ChrB domain-containing protein [Candidatus Binatia bacterium]|jgi:hypothetical protein